MLTVWGRASSSNVQAVMWCIGELRLPFERLDVGGRYGGNDTPAFLEMNPNGTVPVLRDGDGRPIWESGAILRYLANRYGKAPFWPEALEARTLVDQWAEWSKINIAMNFTVPIFWRVVRTPPAQRDASAIRDALATLNKKLALADEQLTRTAFIGGDALSLADIQFGHLLYRYFDIEIERREYPAVRRYYTALTERAPYREHVMVSYDELRAT